MVDFKVQELSILFLFCLFQQANLHVVCSYLAIVLSSSPA